MGILQIGTLFEAGVEDSVKASVPGLEQVDQARKRKGWNRQSAAWAEVALTSVASLKQFWRRERIQQDTFIRICQAVGIPDWHTIAELPGTDSPHPKLLQDWGEAPELSFFCGRQTELATLEEWIVRERAKLVTLLGMGGMGKTTLAVKLAEKLSEAGNGAVTPGFEFVVWRSLRNALPLSTLLADLMRVFLNAQPLDPSLSLTAQLTELITFLRSHRCLLVLDNVESILNAGTIAGQAQSTQEEYGELFRRIGEERHQSCLVLTSREQPREVVRLEGEKVRSLRLRGLPQVEAEKILARVGSLSISEAESRTIVEHYAGNPLALKIVAAGIRDLLSSHVHEFLTLLQQGSFAFSDIQDLLARHFDRLSELEQEVLYWLAIAREPLSLEELKTDLCSPTARSTVTATLESLQRRSLLEISPLGFTLQPAVMEFVINRFLDRLCEQLVVTLNPAYSPDPALATLLIHTHALIKATAKDYLRSAQIRVILEPLIERLRSVYGSTEHLKTACLQHLLSLRGQPALETGYLGGNLLNLLCYLQADLSGQDFSDLTLWQTDLRGIHLNGVNFSRSDLSRSAFTETFSNVLSIAFSPDGTRAASSDERGWISIWQVETGKHLQSFQAHGSWSFSVAFSPDGHLLATGGLDRSVKLWDSHTGNCVGTFQGHTGGISAVAFSPTATSHNGLLASSSTDQTIKLMNLQTGDCQITLTGHNGIVRAIAFSPDGQTLVSVSLDHTIKLWNVASGQCLQTLKDTTAVYAVACTTRPAPTGLLIATAGDDGQIKLWDGQTGDCLQVLTGHTDRIWSLAFASQGTLLTSSSDDHTVKVWDGQTGDCLKTLQGHENRVWSIATSPNGELLASGSDDKTIRFWHLGNGQCLRTLQGYHNGTIPIALRNLAIGPQPTHSETPLLATFSADQAVRVWDIQTRHCLKTVALPTQGAMQAAISPDGCTIACGSLDHTIRLCDLQTGACLQTWRGHTTWVRTVAFSPDGSLLASASGDQTIKLWKVSTGECLQTLIGHSNPVQSVQFAPDRPLLASGSWDQTIKLWDLERGTCLNTLVGHTDQLRELIFVRQGQILISSSQDHTIRWWDVRSGECLKVLKAHTADVESIASSPDDQLLASASQDGSIRLWCLNSGDCLQVLSVPGGYSNGLLFSPDSCWLVSGSGDGTSTLWEVKTGQCLTTLQVPRPYEGMNITDVKGLTAAQRATLQDLGAFEA